MIFVEAYNRLIFLFEKYLDYKHSSLYNRLTASFYEYISLT
jgi:hypothetical protein